MTNPELIAEIEKIKKEKNAIILAHTYVDGAVQDIADFTGDSYALSKKAANIDNADIVVFAGVKFMAETAYILSPDKTILMPVPGAGCPMAEMAEPQTVKAMKEKYPDAKVVCYVNSTAEVKALSDVCVTSSNAVKICRKIDSERIIFVPDRHLGSFVAEQIPEKEFILWPGHCPVHNRVKPEDIINAKNAHPNAFVMIHPEASHDARTQADAVLSTGQMINLVARKEHNEYIVVTEKGIIHGLKKADPDAKYFVPESIELLCPNMKKISIEDILNSLKEEKFKTTVNEITRIKALSSIEKMLELAE